MIKLHDKLILKINNIIRTLNIDIIWNTLLDMKLEYETNETRERKEKLCSHLYNILIDGIIQTNLIINSYN